MSDDSKAIDLIGRLILALIDDAESFSLDSTVLAKRVNWLAKVHINDTGKVVGKKGAHLDALRVVIALIGARDGNDYRFEVDEPDVADRVDKGRVPTCPDFNPNGMTDLLRQVLCAILRGNVNIQIHRNGSSDFTFVLNLPDEKDYKLLATALPTVHGPLTPIAAIGTLFRAYGRQRGAALYVELPSR